MNGKKAKVLRGAARKVTQGFRDRVYQPDRFSPRGTMLPRLLAPTCTRAVYQKLKKEIMK